MIETAETPPAIEAAPPRARRILEPLKVHDFRLLWGGSVLSMLGDQFSFIALAWTALVLTGSPLALGGVLVAAAVPRAIFMLVGGAVSDRFSARTVMAGSSLVRSAAMATTAALIFSHTIQVWELYAVSLVFGFADAFFYPARGALTPVVTPTTQLEAANALLNGGIGLVGVVGAALSGLVVARFGTGPGFAIDAVCFVLVALAVGAIGARPAAAPDSHGGMWAQIRGGLSYAWSDPTLRVMLIALAIVDNALSGPMSIGMPTLARERLGGAVALGIMTSGFAAGTIGGNVLAGALGQLRRLGPVLIGIVATLGAAVLSMGFVHALPVALAVLLVIGVGSGLANVLFFAWLQRRTAAEMQGRIQSIVMLSSLGFLPLTMAAAGAIAQLQVTLLFALAGGIVVLAAIGISFSRQIREL